MALLFVSSFIQMLPSICTSKLLMAALSTIKERYNNFLKMFEDAFYLAFIYLFVLNLIW